jgi:hypothetical protein
VSEPEPITVKRYRCPFCRRSRSSKRATAQHIARCWLNPATRSCKTCANFEEGHDACGCEPGCNWGSPAGGIPAACTAGRNLPDGPEFPVTGCLLWLALDPAEVSRG